MEDITTVGGLLAVMLAVVGLVSAWSRFKETQTEKAQAAIEKVRTELRDELKEQAIKVEKAHVRVTRVREEILRFQRHVAVTHPSHDEVQRNLDRILGAVQKLSNDLKDT